MQEVEYKKQKLKKKKKKKKNNKKKHDQRSDAVRFHFSNDLRFHRKRKLLFKSHFFVYNTDGCETRPFSLPFSFIKAE